MNTSCYTNPIRINTLLIKNRIVFPAMCKMCIRDSSMPTALSGPFTTKRSISSSALARFVGSIPATPKMCIRDRAKDMESRTRRYLMQRLREYGTRFLTSTQVLEVDVYKRQVYGTGTFTIPLMKKVGYRAPFAGAVEAVASTGGQLMPPVMGTAAFLMADLSGAGYLLSLIHIWDPPFEILLAADAIYQDIKNAGE